MSQDQSSTNNISASSRNSDLINELEKKFAELNDLLYTTNVPCDQLENKVLPYIAEDVIFQDPWQEGGNKAMYSIGMKGFHNMFCFTFDTYQIGVQLNNNSNVGRCFVDGVMNLRQFSWIYTFPLRTILIYDFRMLDANHPDGPKFEIFHHQEMWSYMEMIQGIPGVGWIYKNIFRPVFGHLFVGASYLSCLVNDFFKGTKKD